MYVLPLCLLVDTFFLRPIATLNNFIDTFPSLRTITTILPYSHLCSQDDYGGRTLTYDQTLPGRNGQQQKNNRRILFDDDANENSIDKGQSRRRESCINTKRVRSVPVFDPWQNEELTKKRARELYKGFIKYRNNDMQQRGPPNTKTGAFIGFAKNNGGISRISYFDDVILDRVRKNQKRYERVHRQRKSTQEKQINDKRTEQWDDTDPLDDRGFFFFNNEWAVTNKETTYIPNPKEGSKKDRNNMKRVMKDDKISTGLVLPTRYDRVGREMYLALRHAERYVDFNLKSLRSCSNYPSCDEDEAGYTMGYEGITGRDTTTSRKLSKWEHLGVDHPQLFDNLVSMSCHFPLEVQENACSPIINNNDVLVSTHTGSGKTLAFLVPLVHRLLSHSSYDDGNNHNSSNAKGVKVIIIAPGRELASQIASVVRSILNSTGLSIVLAMGGTPFIRNLQTIRRINPSIIVGTPGRIAELILGSPEDNKKGRGRLKIGNVQSIVLDECDALFQYDVHSKPTNAVVNALHRRHGERLQSILCSATAGDLIYSQSASSCSYESTNDKNYGNDNRKLIGILKPGYTHITDDEDDAFVTSEVGGASNITAKIRDSRMVIHGMLLIPHRRFSLNKLRKVLLTEPLPGQVLVFVNNARRVSVIVDKLEKMGIDTAPLHGGVDSHKGDRAEVSKALREGWVGIVVTTELAARGIDAPYLTHVINLDLPTDASHYVHRAGRCGRRGNYGVVVNFAVGPTEWIIPKKFATLLNIDMHTVDTRNGKLVLVKNNLVTKCKNSK